MGLDPPILNVIMTLSVTKSVWRYPLTNAFRQRARDLISSLINVCFVPKCAFLTTAGATVLASWYYLCFLHNRTSFTSYLHTILPNGHSTKLLAYC